MGAAAIGGHAPASIWGSAEGLAQIAGIAAVAAGIAGSAAAPSLALTDAEGVVDTGRVLGAAGGAEGLGRRPGVGGLCVGSLGVGSLGVWSLGVGELSVRCEGIWSLSVWALGVWALSAGVLGPGVLEDVRLVGVELVGIWRARGGVKGRRRIVIAGQPREQAQGGGDAQAPEAPSQRVEHSISLRSAPVTCAWAAGRYPLRRSKEDK